MGKIKTRILNINPDNIDLDKLSIAAEVLKNGKLVVFPTETVYGLGANALDEHAVKKIFKAKGRPSDNPLIVHIAFKSELKDYVKKIPESAKILIENFWPGPLTLILKKKAIIPDATTGGLDTVAIRMPSHPVAHKLIEISGLPVAAPSANISGKPSTTTGKHVIHDLHGKVDIIIDSGLTDIGLESTVVDVTKKPAVLLRPGGITIESLRRFTRVKLHPALVKKTEVDKPESPGMKYRHYAPEAKLIVFSGNEEKTNNAIKQLLTELSKNNMKTAVLSIGKKNFDADLVINLGEDKKEIARNLFNALRLCDSMDVDVILTEAINRKGLGRAIMNRLEKAALYRVIKL